MNIDIVAPASTRSTPPPTDMTRPDFDRRDGAREDADREDVARAARKVGLRLAEIGDLTITRRRAGRGFVYHDASGKRVTDGETLDRIRSLAIPPAYEDVRIAPDPRAHLQAAGRDQAGRLQHRYHPEWNEVRENRKAKRLATLLEVLPAIRGAVARDLERPELDREKAIACAIALIDDAHIRVGCEAYARDNGSHGAATLLKRHVSLRGARIELAFRGKGGKDIACSMEHERLARALKEVAKLPGRRLLQFKGPDGMPQAIGASDVNAYLQRVSGADVTAKDFRMLGASASAAEVLVEMEPGRTEAVRKRQLAGVMRAVADRLANTPAVVRKSYVHALVVSSFQNGALKKAHRLARSGPNRKRVENALARLVARLRRR
jgi:DNA topoisomerase-1